VLRERGFDGPVWVVPQFGVDETSFSPGPPRTTDPAAAGASGRPFVVGYAGRLVKEKGVDLLLRATAAEPHWSLEIAGTGPERAALELAARGREDRVRFLGHLPATELPDFYRRLDVLVLPSRRSPRWIEQFGRVLVEAMACGVACVGADSGEIPRVLGEGGLTFSEGDSDGLHRVLAELAGDDDARTRLGRSGRARVLAHYTMSHVAQQTAAAYRELAALARAPAASA
jgi:glycosyltransferase involved in cell wall biosynthesis